MRALVPFAAGAVIALAAGWIAFPRIIYKSLPQPVNFSHKAHAEKAGTACQDCHSLRPDGSFAGVPTLDKCSSCHAAPMGTSAAEKNFIDHYVTPNREPQWLSYSRQPENVWFSHAGHLKLAGLKCEDCHGAEGAANTLRPYQQDRISGYSRDIWRVTLRRLGNTLWPSWLSFETGRCAAGAMPPCQGLTMDDCIACHRRKGLENSCLECHK